MIRQLREADRAAVTALLDRAPYLNLYMLGNVAANGFDQDFCEFWGDVTDERICGVVNRYMSGWSVYGEVEADWAGLGEVIDNHPTIADRLQDNPGGIASLMPYLPRYVIANLVEESLMELPRGGLREQKAPDGFVVRRATLEDLAGLAKLYADAGDMTRTPAGVERPLRDRRIWMALAEDEVVAAALTNAETSELAMIGGVYTAPVWHGKGLSQAVCSAICGELIEIGLQPILYWHNPSAGHVYSKLGFQPIGIWRALRLAPR